MNIDKQALEETKRVCHEELNQIGCKYNTNHLEIMYLFLKKELRFLLIFFFNRRYFHFYDIKYKY